LGLRKQLPTLLRQPRHPQPSPPEPGNAKPVVVGNGEKRHDPVGSIAGSLSREQPDDNAANTQTNAAMHNQGRGSSVIRLEDVGLIITAKNERKSAGKPAICGW
jgi:hypothetical protein